MEEMLKQFLKNQETWSKERPEIDSEPFAWMDEDTKKLLESKLTQEELEQLDRTARLNMAGQKIMANAARKAIAGNKSYCPCCGVDKDLSIGHHPECIWRNNS